LVFTANIPTWRLDVEREIDLIEEIARLHGYDKFTNTLPAYTGSVVELPNANKDQKLRSSLLALGYDETVSLSFIAHEDAEQFSTVPVIELANPLSAEASVMRTSMVPGMLNMLAYNLNRGSADVRLFESGNVFQMEQGTAKESKQICLGATGSAVTSGVHQPARALTFFDLKGDIEDLLHAFQFKSLQYNAQVSEYYHPGRAARAVMDGVAIAQFGQIHPETAASRKFKQDIFVAEIYLAELYKHDLRHVRYRALPRFPAVERDFSFVFPDSVVFAKIEQAVLSLKLEQLRSFVPAEIFRGGNVATGKYSILLRANFQSNERTLREDEITQWSSQITRALESLGGTQRV
jgi:phenylalanyl-tRNA synthetase beta chain